MSSLNYIIPFVAYLIVANPALYKVVRGVLGSWVASAEGTATTAGLFLHALVYILIVGFLMRFIGSRSEGLTMMPTKY
jgi:hypothetical protein